MTTPIRITKPYIIPHPTIGKPMRLLEELASLLNSCMRQNSAKDKKKVNAYLNAIAESMSCADTALFRANQIIS